MSPEKTVPISRDPAKTYFGALAQAFRYKNVRHKICFRVLPTTPDVKVLPIELPWVMYHDSDRSLDLDHVDHIDRL